MFRRFMAGKPEYRDIPKGSRKVASKRSSAVAYLYERAGKCYAVGFYGKAVKNAFHHSFRSAEKRMEFVGKWLVSMDGSAASKVARAEEAKAKRAAGHKLKVGSILRSSWGYDQTNVDYYEVIELVGKCSVRIHEIGAESVDDGPLSMSGNCVPCPGSFRKDREPRLKRVSPSGDSVSIASYASAYLIEPVAELEGGKVKVYPKSYWSSYA